MMTNSDKFSGGYYRTSFEAAGEMEGSGSSGRIAADFTVSEDFDAPSRKCINLNSQKQDTFGVPAQYLSLSHVSPSERKALTRRLKLELEQVRVLQKRIELPRTNGVTVLSSIDILSCSNGNNGYQTENLRKSSAMNSKSGKKVNPSGTLKGWNRGSSGKFESAKQVAANTTNIMLMKQCETLLKRLMKHEFAWVFNTPVDVVKLNIPDYLTIIKHPMDLGTILKKVGSGACASPLEFLDDVRLTFRNAMEYNPPGHDVYIMADSMSKFFEVRWKAIEKKLPKADVQELPAKSSPHDALEPAETSVKKRKMSSFQHENVPEPVKRVITEEERNNLGRELKSLLAEMPLHIIDFLKEHSSNGNNTEDDEIEIDIDDLSDDTLIKLRKLLDDYLQEKQKNQARGEQCEIEMLNESGPSISSMQQHKGNDIADDDVDIGGNEAPVSSYPPVEIEKDTSPKSSKVRNSHGSGDLDIGSSSESESENTKPTSPLKPSKVPETLDSEVQIDNKTSAENRIEANQSGSGLDHVDHTSLQKPSSVEFYGPQDGDSARSEREVSPEKLYRFAQLKNRFLDTILKAREKTLSQDDKGDPEKMRQEREELELQKKKEKARLQAEVKAAEEARRQAEAAAAAEARRKRELEREAARQALLQMEKTVEINENSRFLEDLEMLRTVPGEHAPSSVDETSPDHSQNGLGGFRFGGSANPLEQLGLFMKEDEDEEEGENHHLNFSNPPPPPLNDVEEGEID